MSNIFALSNQLNHKLNRTNFDPIPIWLQSIPNLHINSFSLWNFILLWHTINFSFKTAVCTQWAKLYFIRVSSSWGWADLYSKVISWHCQQQSESLVLYFYRIWNASHHFDYFYDALYDYKQIHRYNNITTTHVLSNKSSVTPWKWIPLLLLVILSPP